MFGNILPGDVELHARRPRPRPGHGWTTLHLMMEQQVADVLGIPFDTVQQVCLSPARVHRRAPTSSRRRGPPADSIIHWDQW